MQYDLFPRSWANLCLQQNNANNQYMQKKGDGRRLKTLKLSPLKWLTRLSGFCYNPTLPLC